MPSESDAGSAGEEFGVSGYWRYFLLSRARTQDGNDLFNYFLYNYKIVLRNYFYFVKFQIRYDFFSPVQ